MTHLAKDCIVYKRMLASEERIARGDPSNKDKRRRQDDLDHSTEHIMIIFGGPYHTILGRPCFVKFMVVPNYMYLKMKMRGPLCVIMVAGNLQDAYQCDWFAVEHVVRNLHPDERELDYEIEQSQDSGAPRPAPPRQEYRLELAKPKVAPPIQFSPSGPSTPPAFMPGDDSKKVQLKEGDDSKTTNIGKSPNQA